MAEANQQGELDKAGYEYTESTGNRCVTGGRSYREQVTTIRKWNRPHVQVNTQKHMAKEVDKHPKLRQQARLRILYSEY